MNNPPRLNKTNVLILVPAYNEQLSIKKVLLELRQHNFKVLVIDDGSTDETRSVAIDLNQEVLSLPFNLGVGGALRAGFTYACRQKFLAVVQVDADGQHDVGAIESLITESNTTGAHMVLGSRFQNTEQTMTIGVARRIVMSLLALMASKATATKITDATSGFRLIREPLLSEFSKVFPRYYLGDTYEALISAGRAGYTICEIPTVISNRQHGSSSASNTQAIKFIFKSVMVAVLGIHSRIPTLKSQ
jgi:glycosyltransferase involved in cell wall biosynthesis